MLGETPIDDEEKYALLEVKMEDLRKRIYNTSNTSTVAPLIVDDLCTVIDDFYLSADQVVNLLFPFKDEHDKLPRAVAIINAALVGAGRRERVTVQDFTDKLVNLD